MIVQIFERKQEDGESRIEMRTYNLPDHLERVLIDKTRSLGEVWGFDVNDKQYNGILIEIQPHVVIMG